MARSLNPGAVNHNTRPCTLASAIVTSRATSDFIGAAPCVESCGTGAPLAEVSACQVEVAVKKLTAMLNERSGDGGVT